MIATQADVCAAHSSPCIRSLVDAWVFALTSLSSFSCVHFSSGSMASSQPAVAPGAAGAASTLRALLQGAPSLFASLQRQRANLERFLCDRADDFAALPYVPWTTPPAQPAPGTAMRASSLSSAHIGVYPTEERRSAASKRRAGGRKCATRPVSDLLRLLLLLVLAVAIWLRTTLASSCRSIC